MSWVQKLHYKILCQLLRNRRYYLQLKKIRFSIRVSLLLLLWNCSQYKLLVIFLKAGTCCDFCLFLASAGYALIEGNLICRCRGLDEVVPVFYLQISHQNKLEIFIGILESMLIDQEMGGACSMNGGEEEHI
jgi:hypothetical protein